MIPDEEDEEWEKLDWADVLSDMEDLTMRVSHIEKLILAARNALIEADRARIAKESAEDALKQARNILLAFAPAGDSGEI